MLGCCPGFGFCYPGSWNNDPVTESQAIWSWTKLVNHLGFWFTVWNSVGNSFCSFQVRILCTLLGIVFVSPRDFGSSPPTTNVGDSKRQLV